MEDKKLIKEYHGGYIQPAITPEDYVAGADRSIANKLGGVDPIIQADGNWSEYLPDNETQVKKIETCNCTAFGATSQLEILIRKLFNLAVNKSDRYTGIKAGTRPPGNNPQNVYNAIREYGVIPEEMLPFNDSINSIDDYYSFKGANEKDCDNTAKGFLIKHNFRHEYLPRQFSGWIDNEIIKKALKYSPISVAVQGWTFDGEKYIRDGEDGHWTTLTGWEGNGDWRVYDSYPPYRKILSKDFGFRIAKRIWLTQNLNPEQIGIFQKILELIKKILGINQQIIDEIKNPEPQPEPEPTPEPVKISKLIPFAKAIEAYENFNKLYYNPGAIRGVNGKFLKFNTYQEGFNYLCDYIKRVSEGKHAAYPYGGETSMIQFFQIYSPVIDGNSPIRYCSWVCNQIGVNPQDEIKDVV